MTANGDAWRSRGWREQRRTSTTRAENSLLSAPSGSATAGRVYLAVDMLGSTRLVTNGSAATAVECEDFLPFGQQIPSAANGRSASCFTAADAAPEKKFTGKERDTESGLDYFAARYMSGTQGRFMSPDWSERPRAIPYAKLNNPQSLNLYSYVWNTPLLRNDPDGHAARCAGDQAQRAQCASDLKKLSPGTKVADDGTVSKASLLHRIGNYLAGNGAGTALVSRIVNDSHLTTITTTNGNQNGQQLRGTVSYDPAGGRIMTRDGNGDLVGANASGTIVLGHELIHQDHENRGLQDMAPSDHIFGDQGLVYREVEPREEFRTVGFPSFVLHGDITENQLEKQLHQPVRATYTDARFWFLVPQN